MKEIIRHHRPPQSIVSDHGRVFTSQFWEELQKLQGTKLYMSSTYQP